MVDFKGWEAGKIESYSVMARDCNLIDPELYVKYEVKRGLRDISGKGVLVGLTEIGEVNASKMDEGVFIPAPGQLIYRGIDINRIVDGFMMENRYGFEESCYLLLFGVLPNRKSLDEFKKIMSSYMRLPPSFIENGILRIPSRDIMNLSARGVLALYAYDEAPDDITLENVVRQCLQLIARLPLIAVYGYQTLSHYFNGNSLIIHSPVKEYGVAENILHLLRPDSSFTSLEAKLLDLALVLHAEHGGGNNSSFTTHVVTSSATDTYSVMAAAMGSLKGPRHGGANLKVVHMFEDMKHNIKCWDDDDEIQSYLMKLLNKEAFDRSGLIYGVGHAVYSVSDPRAVIFKDYVEKLSLEKGCEQEYKLYQNVERLAPAVISANRRMYKGVSINVDFYSGFVYRMLGIPEELFTPLFAISRIVGWSAHRIEELVNNGKIIRPAYKSIAQRKDYVPLDDRL